MSQRTIIDGYNLLHAAGLVRGKLLGKQLEGARHRLMRRLAYQMSKEERAHTTVVFDAKAMLAVSSREELIEGFRILYPEPGHEADELIEQLISQDVHPRKLTVVSSDRRLHRAARERMATAINSDRFLDHLDEKKSPPPQAALEGTSEVRRTVPIPPSQARKPSDTKGTPGDVDYWLKEFGDVDIPEDIDLTSALEHDLAERPASDTSSSPKIAQPSTQTKPSRPAKAQQPLVIPLPPRPDRATLPPRNKNPLTTVLPDPDPEPSVSDTKPIDADLEMWKDVLKQVLDEESR